jgi:hypothetical protein
MDKVEVKFGEWFEKGFNLYKENISTLILASLIALLLSAVTVGILAGPMFAGLIFITLGFFDKREPAPEVGNVFKGFDYFLNALLFVIVWGLALIVVSFILAIIPCVGQVASLFVVYAVQAFLLFGLFLIVDKGMEFWPASMESYNKVKTNFWPFLGFAVVTSIIGSIGAIACGIGLAITAPIQICMLTVAYREVFGDVDAAAPVEGAPPPEASPDSETPPQEPSTQ